MTTRRFAEKTTVGADRTLTEISKTVKAYGATGFVIGEEASRIGVQFTMRNRRIKFIVSMPDPSARDFTHVKSNQYGGMRLRSDKEHDSAYEQAVRQRWRALLLTIKAKLESVESGIETLEEAFQAQLVLPDGRTVGDWLAPQIEAAYATGKMPPLMMTDGKS
jgi:hypothetical protein